ncbi:MAG: InlB B-repeat-containing protein, partial [Clostridia bacterium]|nr:InlB B-repeat-containing protein [Clostridia bacterium]
MTTTRHPFRKKALAMLLTVLMVFGNIGVISTLFTPIAQAAELTSVMIGVPETVYMTPQNDYNTATTSVKYYVNNTVNSSGVMSLDASNSATTGKFYVYSPQISSINSVSVNGATLSDLSATKSGSLFSDTSFTMSLTSGLSSSQSQLLEWTINVTDTAGAQHNLHAYTVAYAPYLSPVFAAGKCKNTRGGNSFGSGMSWVSGIHGISAEGGYYPYNNFLPLCGGPSLGDGETSPDSWFNGSQQCNLPTKSGWYTTKEYGYNYGDETLAVFERSGEAYINVDTSRYTNLNQVPNLVCGLYVSDCEGATGTVWGYVGKLQNWDERITSGRNWYTRSTTYPSEYTAGVDYFGGDCWTNRGKNWVIRDARMNMSVPSGWIAIRGGLGTDGSGDRCFCILDCYLNVIQVNKSDLRNLIKDCYKYTNTVYPGDEYESFISAWRSAATVLGDPTRTDVSDVYTNLNNAKNKLHALTALSLNTEVVVNPTDSACRYYTFTPSDTGKYVFFTYDTDNSPDPYLYIYLPNISNLSGHESTALYSNDDIGDEKIRELLAGSQDNFGSWQSYIVTSSDLTAGTTYIVKAYNRHKTGTYPLKVCKAVDVTFNATGGATTFTKTLPAGHTLYMNQSGLTRDGHTLIAWSGTNTQDEAKICMASDVITVPTSNKTYYALWYPDNAPTLNAAGDYQTAVIDAAGEIEYYQFTPSETRKYLIYGAASGDSYVLFYNADTYYSNGTYIEKQDDSTHSNGNNTGYDFNLTSSNQFFLLKELTANTTYLYGVKYYGAGTGSIPFYFEPVYKVEYDANGGSGAPSVQDKFLNKDLTISSTVPTRTGYDFLGWSTSSSATTATYAAGGTYSANADTKLYAVWTPTVYSISYNLDGGSVATANPPSYTIESSSITLNNPTKTGYTFKGWSGTDLSGDSNKTVTIPAGSIGDRSYTANWTINSYTVTFKNWDGSVLKTESVNYGSDATPPADPTRAADATNHYTFDGWSGYTNITADKTITATFTATQHTFTSSIKTPATCIAKGWHTYTCSCGYSYDLQDIAINPANHTDLQHTAAVAATCEEDCNIEYWYCSGCGKYYSNAAGTTEITEAQTVIGASGHNWGTPTYSWSDDGKTCTATRVCGNNSSHTQTETATVANGKITSSVKTAATCAAMGTTTYTAAFSNTAFAQQTKDVEDLAIDPANHTNLQHFAANSATCDDDGNIEYWYCSGCGKYYSNAAGTSEITEASTVIGSSGHSYTFNSFVWSADGTTAQAKYVCSNNASHTKLENATMTHVDHAATCDDDAYTVYTATYDGHTADNTVTNTGSALGHTYQFNSFVWSADGTTAQA